MIANVIIKFKFLKMAFICPHQDCGKAFTRNTNLNRHYQNFHCNENIVEKCFICHQIFKNCDDLQKHYKKDHVRSKKFVVLQSAFIKSILTYRYTFPENSITLANAQASIQNKIKNVILCEAAKKNVCKISLVFIAQMTMLDHAGEKMTMATIPFRASNFLANASTPSNISKNIIRSFNQQSSNVDEFMLNGSNWHFDRALFFDIEVAALRPIVAGSEQSTLKLPENDPEKELNISSFKNNRFLFNPTNKDMKCFLYCIAYSQHSKEVDKRSKKSVNYLLKKYVEKYNTQKIDFPISIKGIKRFMKINNHLDLKINILLRTKNKNGSEEIFPYEFGLGNGSKVINLLMVQNEIEKNRGVNHFLLIKDVNKYLRNVYIKNKKISYQKSFFCLNCLNFFSSPRVLQEHEKICNMNKPRKEVMPTEKETKIFFKNYERQQELEYTAYLDFECVLPPEKNPCEICKSLKCKCDASFTDIISKQNAIGFNFLVLGPQDKIIHEESFIGENAAEEFVEHLLIQENKWIKNLLRSNNEMVMKPIDNINFNQATNCYICDEEFSSDNYKCRDHDHISSEYLGAACNRCNLRRRKPSSLKIFVHNGSRYDFHFIVKALGKFNDEIHSLKVLPFNGENFRTISFNCFEFIDSLAFLQSSLSELASDLKESGHTYNILKQTDLVKTNGKFDKNKYNVLLEKSFFPYEYCHSLKQMAEVYELPEIKHFSSSLTETTISKNDHKFAKKVWNIFKCNDLIDYTKLYNRIDTILLAEIFQKFRKDMHKFSGLDPAHYISLPSYSYDSMLKLTKSIISLPTDINMIHFLESGKRGGVAFIGTREMKPSFKENEESEIVYLDANVMYLDAISPEQFHSRVDKASKFR